MNESLRWKLVLGCLMIAVLEVPHTLLVLVEDFGGPYPVGNDSAVGTRAAHPTVGMDVLFASHRDVVSEAVLVADRHARGHSGR